MTTALPAAILNEEIPSLLPSNGCHRVHSVTEGTEKRYNIYIFALVRIHAGWEKLKNIYTLKLIGSVTKYREYNKV